MTAVSCCRRSHCRVCVAHRRPPNDRRQGGNECGRRPPIGTRARELVRVLIVTQNAPTYRRPDKSGGGGFRCWWWLRCASSRGVVLSGRGCIKSAFLFRRPAPRNQHPRKWGSSRRLREINPRLAGLSLGSATNSAGPPVIKRRSQPRFSKKDVA